MILLTATNQTVEITTSAAVALDVTVSWVDNNNALSTYEPGSARFNITTATTTTIVSAPAAGKQRRVHHISIRAVAGSNDIIVQQDEGGTNYQMMGASVTAGEQVYYTDTDGWRYVTSVGELKVTIGSGGGAGDGLNRISAGTQLAGTLATVVFSNANNVTFGMTNSSIVTASASFAQSNQQITMFATGNTTQSSTNTTNASSMIFAGSGIASVGLSGGTILVSVPAQSNQQITLFATGNTTQSSTGTTNASSVIFRGGGDASVGITAGSIVISTPLQTNQQITMFATGNTTQSSTNTTNASSVIFAGSGAASVGLSGGTILVSVPLQTNQQITMFATGNTTLSSTGTTNASSLIFAGSGGVSVGITDGSILISGNTGGGGAGATRNFFSPFQQVSLSTINHGNGSVHFSPMAFPNLSIDRVAMPLRFSNATNSTGTLSLSLGMVLYTRNASTLSSMHSISTTVSLGFAGPNSSSDQVGMKLYTFGWSTSISEGDYWVGVWSRTSTGGADCSVAQAAGVNWATAWSGPWNAVSAATHQTVLGLGYYTNTTSAPPGTVAFSQINGTASTPLRIPVWHLAEGTY